MDKISPERRSINMSKIRSKNTKPELTLRKALYKKHLRYRVHFNLPGKPDVVFMSKRVAIFVNGCFWHKHGCSQDHLPKSNRIFWRNKIKNNVSRDKNNVKLLSELGWEVLTYWECELKKDCVAIANQIYNKLQVNK